MTTYETCQAVLRAIVIRAAEVMNYTNWSDEFSPKQEWPIISSPTKWPTGLIQNPFIPRFKMD